MRQVLMSSLLFTSMLIRVHLKAIFMILRVKVRSHVHDLVLIGSWLCKASNCKFVDILVRDTLGIPWLLPSRWSISDPSFVANCKIVDIIAGKTSLQLFLAPTKVEKQNQKHEYDWMGRLCKCTETNQQPVVIEKKYRY